MEQERWPFVGRGAQVRELAPGLVGRGRPRSLLLRGPAGVGKTRLARELAGQLEGSGHELVWLQAATGLSAVPFGALAPLLVVLGLVDAGGGGDDGRAGAADPTSGASLLAAVLARAGAHPRLALVVDDVPRADPGSLAAVQALARQGAVPVVFTARDTDALPEVVVSLLDDGTAVAVEVEPLDRQATDELLAGALGQPADPTSARLLHDASGGNPLFLRELVRGARAAGTVQPGAHGVVVATVPSRRLIDLLDDRLSQLGEDERRILELLAAGQPLPVDVLGPDGAVDELESAGLVAVADHADHAGRLVARLAHPVYDEVLRSTTPRGRWRRRQAGAAALLRAGGSDDELLRAVALEVGAGEAIDVGDLLRAARRSYALLDHELTLALADRAVAAGGASAGQQLRGAALSALGRGAEAEAALEAALAAATTDEEVARAAQPLAQHLAVRANRPAEAVAQVEAALARTGDPAWRSFLEADRVRWAMLAGQAGAAPAYEPGDDQEGVARLNGLMTEALVALMGGRLSVADRAIAEGLPLAEAHRDVIGHATELLTLSRCMLLLFSGEMDAAHVLASDELARAGDRNEEPVGMWAYALGAIDLHRGRAGEASRWGALATARLEWRDYTGLAPTARALHATGLAQLGRVAEARHVLGGLAPEALADAWAAMQGAQARAWIEVAEGQVATAAAVVAEHGRAGMDGGHLYLGALTSYVAVRVGRAEAVAADLQRAATQGEGALLPALAAHATALAERRPVALVEVAEVLAGLGVAGAVDALDQAARLHDGSGRGEAARRARQRAHRLAEGGDAPRVGVRPGVGGEPLALTPRERQVAALAADRRRSREIADELGLSVRTVDNHLAKAYRKLGVATRHELAAALAERGLRLDDV